MTQGFLSKTGLEYSKPGGFQNDYREASERRTIFRALLNNLCRKWELIAKFGNWLASKYCKHLIDIVTGILWVYYSFQPKLFLKIWWKTAHCFFGLCHENNELWKCHPVDNFLQSLKVCDNVNLDWQKNIILSKKCWLILTWKELTIFAMEAFFFRIKYQKISWQNIIEYTKNKVSQ